MTTFHAALYWPLPSDLPAAGPSQLTSHQAPRKTRTLQRHGSSMLDDGNLHIGVRRGGPDRRSTLSAGSIRIEPRVHDRANHAADRAVVSAQQFWS